MHDILISTGALIGRPNGRDYRLLEEFVPRLNSDGIEFMLYSTWYDDLENLISFLKKNKFYAPVMHCQKTLSEKLCGLSVSFEDGNYIDNYFSEEEDAEKFKIGVEEFEKNLKVCDALGARKMVFHAWNGLPSDKQLDKNIERFGILAEMAKKEGITLMVENVICNQYDPASNLRSFKNAYKDVAMVYDTKMAAFHNQAEILFEDGYKDLLSDGNIKHFHINDYGGGYMDWSNLKVLPIGEGRIDFDSFFDKLSKYDYAGDFTIESTAFRQDGHVDFEMLEKCVSDLRKLVEGNR